MPTALITGVNGQDGSYLAELLLAKDYRVVGTTPDRRVDQERIAHIRERIELVESDLRSQQFLENLLQEHKPQEIYNLAARASSNDLWTDPVQTGDINGLSVTRCLGAILKIDPKIRFVQASSSEIFGNPVEVPQTENTPLRPRNTYGIAKGYAHWAVGLYRQHQGIFACSAILYNHESPRRGQEFVTRKIARAAAKISMGQEKELRLGRLDARRDWGFAGDYVEAMWLMLQQPKADDYIVATGESHSVGDFCELAFSRVGLDYREFVIEDQRNLRPPEERQLLGNADKAKRLLGWKPSVNFPGLVKIMVDAEVTASHANGPKSGGVSFLGSGARSMAQDDSSS
jgi:GDPmannose 4,6-dehydratase